MNRADQKKGLMEKKPGHSNRLPSLSTPLPGVKFIPKLLTMRSR